MRFLQIPVYIAFCPVSALAAETVGEAGGFSLVSGTVRMVASLAVVIGVILVFQYLSRKWMKGPFHGGSRGGYIRVVENRFLAPKKALLLVEVSGEYMLLSSCGDNINFIKQVDMIEEVEIIGEESPVSFRETLQDRLKGLTARFPAAACTFPSVLRKGGIRP
ncbi:MAG TPA: flagellar biosynthetic protein FliO [Geobacteraceae bacterium]|nr:flagellar biosynthetic protein FliO [Geobacteraceae bacterium]